MKLDRVLVPIDFSEPARRALTEAAALTAAKGGRLTLLHAHPIRQVSILEFNYVEPAEAVRAYVELAEKHLATWAEEVGIAARADVRVTSGEPVATIVEASAAHDLCVMATHGRSGLEHLVMGSVAERVVRNAKCSVLVVR